MYLDIIIISLLLLIPFVGYKKGFVLSCVGVLGSVFCVVLALKITPVFSEFVETKTDIPHFVSNMLSGYNDSIINLPNSKIYDVITKILSVQSVELTINKLLIGAFCFMFVYVFVRICISIILKSISKLVNKLPILGKINSVLGLVLGVAKAFIFVFAMCGFVMLMTKMPGLNEVINSQIEQSALYVMFGESSASVVDVFLSIVNK